MVPDDPVDIGEVLHRRIELAHAIEDRVLGRVRHRNRIEQPVVAILVEIDEQWASDTKAYIKWECQDA
ncbi:hypothetical protein GCM10011494_35080 [Novosphingobium endophyticum]|uniref:Uncharacterized protein n=1 Tax=Novosphingobium endophyticum TaxID=1955250 RepID=A0A916X709_9SPHN|nr:hypothetical protein GCM10011494_35080 [Novosphingobium endophyticum]